MKNDIKKWVWDNFRFALHNNSRCEFNEEERNDARSCFIGKDLERFNANDRENLINAFAVLIRSIKNSRAGLQDFFKIRGGHLWREHNNTVLALNKLFGKPQITEIVLRGRTRAKDITIRGKYKEEIIDCILEYLQTNEEFLSEVDVLQYVAQDKEMKSIGAKLKQVRETKTESKGVKAYRVEISKNVDDALKRLTSDEKENYTIIRLLLNVTEMWPGREAQYKNTEVRRSIKGRNKKGGQT